MQSVNKNMLLLVTLVSGLATALPAWTLTGSDNSAESANAIIVEHISGNVDVKASGISHSIDTGSAIALPSHITTGSDGNLSIRQSRTGVVIAPDSEIEIPETAGDGQLIARMIQHRGQAFYDVEPRAVEKLRIETPFMVAVVKGTQFSVSIGADQTTISLFEGVLELRSFDDQQVVEISAGEIAIGSLTGGIQVLPMDPDLFEEAVAAEAGASQQQESSTVAAIRSIGETTDVGAVADIDVGAGIGGVGVDISIGDQPETVELSARANDGFQLGLSLGAPGSQAPVNLGGGSVDLGLDTNLEVDGDLAGGSVAVGLDTGLEIGADLGGGSVEIGLDTGLDVGGDLAGGSVAVGLDTGLDIGADLGGGSVDVGLDTGLDIGGDLGGGSLDLGLDAGLDVGGDLGGGSVAVGLDTGLDIGADLGGGSVAVGLDTGLDVGGDLGGGSVDVGLDTGLDLGGDLGGDLDVGLDVGLDLGGGVTAEIEVGDLELELDLGAELDSLLNLGDEEDSDSDTDDSSDTDGGLLDSLLSPLF